MAARVARPAGPQTLAMLRDRDLSSTLRPREEYYRQDLAWFVARIEELDRGYLALLEEIDEPFLEGEFEIPWFERPISRRDGILQALSRSAQHRAQVLSTLGERGVEVPGVDLVVMVQES